MSINIKIIQRKDKASKSNTAPIHIRFTLKGKVRYLATGVVLPLGAWNDTEQHIIPSYPDSEVLQMQITAKRLDIEKKIQRLEALDTEVSFDTLFGQKSRYINCTVSEYFQQQIDYLKNIGKVGSAVKYTSCKHLLEQCGLGRKRFEQIDLQYLQDFEAFLIRKGNTSNSIATKFSVLRAVYNKAVKHKVFAETENPFKQYNVGRFWKPTRKRAITKEDVQRIQSLELPASTEVYSTAFARDIFLFSYCVAGINFKDIYTRYSEIRREKPIMLTTDWETELAEAVYPFIRDAYTKLGDQRVKALKYRVGAIQDALTAMSKADTDLKIVEMADRRFTKQRPIPVKHVKEELQKIYDTLGIGKRAKATDMEQWYETATMSRKIEGKTVSCMTIIMNRLARTDF